MFACFFSYRTYIYIINNRCNTRVTCSGFKVYIYDVTYVGLSLCIMFCGKLCIQTVSDENCERYGRHSGSKITLRLIARGWLPEGNLKNCAESLLRFLLCLLFMGQKTWRDMETAWTCLWLFTWHRNVGNLDLCLGISYFFGESIYVKWIETEINPRFGVFHIQKDEARHFRNEISEAVSICESFNAGLPLPTVPTVPMVPMVPMVPRTMLDAGEYLAEPALWVKGWRYQGQLQVRATGPGWIWQVS